MHCVIVITHSANYCLCSSLSSSSNDIGLIFRVLDKTSKFMHYNPDILVVSGVSWDHINVFPTLESYEKSIDPTTKIILSTDNKYLKYLNQK